MRQEPTCSPSKPPREDSSRHPHAPAVPKMCSRSPGLEFVYSLYSTTTSDVGREEAAAVEAELAVERQIQDLTDLSLKVYCFKPLLSGKGTQTSNSASVRSCF